MQQQTNPLSAGRERSTPVVRTHRRRLPRRADVHSSAAPTKSHIAAEPISAQIPSPLAVIGHPIRDWSDPRWVLAVRTAHKLQGYILPPEDRMVLIRTGTVMGLTAFDANLIIAIVQDQARRGYDPDECPTRAEAQLSMVPPPASHRSSPSSRLRGTLSVALVIAAVLAAELLAIRLLLP